MFQKDDSPVFSTNSILQQFLSKELPVKYSIVLMYVLFKTNRQTMDKTDKSW